MKKNLFNTAILSLVVVFFLTGCSIEGQYYRKNNRHSSEYENRHRPEHDKRVEVEIHH